MGEGKLTQIIGAVLDIRFEKEELPALYNAIHIPYQDSYVVAEVMQHLGNDTVRCVAMSATEGLQRGMKAIDTGAPIKVPVGKEDTMEVSKPIFMIGFKDKIEKENKVQRHIAIEILMNMLIGKSSPLYQKFVNHLIKLA